MKSVLCHFSQKSFPLKSLNVHLNKHFFGPKAQQAKAREHQQQLQMQQVQLMQQRQAQLQRNNHPSLSGPINTINSDGILGTSTASVLAAKMYEERLKHPHSMESEASTQLLDASRMALLKSAGNQPG